MKQKAKQQEKKRKAEKKLHKEILKEEKKRQKEMEKRIAKENKKKEAKKRKEEKKMRKAEKEAARVKKATEKAAAKAAVMRKKKQLKQETQQTALKKSDEQLATENAETEAETMRQPNQELSQQTVLSEINERLSPEKKRNAISCIDEWRERQEDIRRMIEKISETEEAINILKEKLERKEDKLAYLREQVMSDQLSSTLDVDKLHHNISECNSEIQNLVDTIAELKESVTMKKEELDNLANAPFVDGDQDGDSLCSFNSDNTNDNCSVDVLDVMNHCHSDPQDSENEEVQEQYYCPFKPDYPFEGEDNLYQMEDAGLNTHCFQDQEEFTPIPRQLPCDSLLNCINPQNNFC